ncbi:uncharacterized protein CMU_036520 [Cryptosporidium muris RN66]|uniref:Uncharacterized protein n=1 Tax=Cryptosporidium muris (strain RN66) TaxID=441375 RepID=B6AGY7_CRYMR|nr:uncharacterized protein CMU_036520 [Cryptosporidium muris RN66]EEA07478.1 hypothetical protein, conserved [Cryptosporidium muris RN66]|eukprot:XP_002141827.1 hypothetical protein [Cryptosporidium muris RN66]
MSESGIVGIILTVKWSSQEPEIVFHFPSDSYEILPHYRATFPSWLCFGIESSKLAHLILPSEAFLWDKLSDLVIETNSNCYRFMFFPCSSPFEVIGVYGNCGNRNNTLQQESINNYVSQYKNSQKSFIENFSVCLVLNATSHFDFQVIEELMKSLTYTLINAEASIGMLSSEVEVINYIIFEYFEDKEKFNLEAQQIPNMEGLSLEIIATEKSPNKDGNCLMSNIENKSILAQQFVKLYKSLNYDYKNFIFSLNNGFIRSDMLNLKSKFIPLEYNWNETSLSVDYHKICNTHDTSKLLELIIEISDPHLSIKEISNELLEPLSSVLRCCYHLVNNDIARFIDKIDYRKKYVLVNSNVQHKIEAFSKEFNSNIDWKSCCPLIVICSFFCNGDELSIIKKKLVQFCLKYPYISKFDHYIDTAYNNNKYLLTFPKRDVQVLVTSIISWLVNNHCITILKEQFGALK